MADWTDYDYVWFEGWNKRQVLRVDQTTGAGANYELKINVTWTEDYRSDFKDLRITYLNGTDLKWWIEQLAEGSFCALWLKVPVDLDAESFECFWWSQNPIADTYYNSSATDVFKRVISSGVVLALPMDEGSGTSLTDYSGNTNTGTFGASAPSWITTGKFGTALDFDSDFVTCADSASLRLLGAHSCVAWVYLDSYPAAANTIARKLDAAGDGYMFRIRDNNKLNTQLLTAWGASLNLDGTATYTLTAWHCNIYTLDDALNGNVYMDSSVSRGTAVSAANAGDSTGRPLYIGESEAAIDVINGKLNGLFLFNYALSETEINDFVAYYPQCSSIHLGSLFLRTYVDGGVSYGFIVMEDISNMDYIYLVGLLGVIGVSLVLFKLKLGVVGLVWGIFGIAIAASMAGNQAVPFYPYLTLGVAVIGTLLVLYSGYEMRGA